MVQPSLGSIRAASLWAAASAGPVAAGTGASAIYLVAAGQVVDVPVTFAPGTYTFVCDPHTPTGMKGKLTVTG